MTQPQISPMGPELKSAKEIAVMDDANKIVMDILRTLYEMIQPGIPTKELDREAEKLCKKYQVLPAFKGYMGYPASLCVSINDEIVHGIPSSKRYLQEGDLVSIDFGVVFRGYYGDAAFTAGVGKLSQEAQHLKETTLKALKRVLEVCTPGHHLGDIGYTIQSVAEEHGYSVVRDFVGHGIGTRLHEPPQVPNFGKPRTGMPLLPGLVIAIEPMVCQGSSGVKVDKDGWTARTKDGKLSSHFEYSVAITAQGPKVLGSPWF